MEQKKTSLYDLQALAFRTEIELEENGGELTPEIERLLPRRRARYRLRLTPTRDTLISWIAGWNY